MLNILFQVSHGALAKGVLQQYIINGLLSYVTYFPSLISMLCQSVLLGTTVYTQMDLKALSGYT